MSTIIYPRRIIAIRIESCRHRELKTKQDNSDYFQNQITIELIFIMIRLEDIEQQQTAFGVEFWNFLSGPWKTPGILKIINFLPWPQETPGILKISSMANENTWNFEIFFHGLWKLLQKQIISMYYWKLQKFCGKISISFTYKPSLQKHLTHVVLFVFYINSIEGSSTKTT